MRAAQRQKLASERKERARKGLVCYWRAEQKAVKQAMEGEVAGREPKVEQVLKRNQNEIEPKARFRLVWPTSPS